MELTKLIARYKKEKPGWAYSCCIPYGREVIDVYHEDFVLWLASRPTCGVEQRKFLDEVEKGRHNPSGVETGLHIGRYTVIWPGDTTADLSKVIKGE
jgi:hypothetical protein